ncbi:hypothetical protein NMR63_000386 [Vibrio cholerae]|nr:hypothetical protein [Vibrio cholerae]
MSVKVSKIQKIQNCAKSIFEQTKEFDSVEITSFDDGGALVEIEGVEVYLKENGEIETTVINL